MKKLNLNLKNIKESDIDLIVDHLKTGKVVAMPTDTIYGLHCKADNRKAIKKIFRIKKRKGQKPLLILVSSLEMVRKYCYVSQKGQKFLRKIWAPGNKPASVVLKSRGKFPEELTAGLDSVGVRLPKSGFLTTIIERVGRPIASSSLNISGQKPLSDLEGVDKYFKDLKPDLIVDAGEIKGTPSGLVDLRDVNDIKVLRK